MKHGLGRGLDALFSIYQDEEEQEVDEKKESRAQVGNNGNESIVNSGVVELDMKLIDPKNSQGRNLM